MNRISKKLALILMILSSNALIAYEWTFRNLTTKPLVVALKLQAWGYTYYDVINPGENTSRFSWPIGSWKAGFCISTFLVGEMTKQDLRNIFGKTSRPTMEEIAYACGDTVGRDQLARVGKSEIPIKWISGERWGLFDKSTRAAVKALTKSITGITEEAVNLAVAAGAEAATSGTTGGTAGAAAYKLKLGKIFAILDTIPGTIMDLAYKSRCTARHFDIIEKRDGSLVANTKDE